MKNKFLVTKIVAVVAMFFVMTTFAVAQNGNRAARMNAGNGVTLSGNGIEALYKTAEERTGLAMMLDQAVGQDWQDNLEIVNSWTVPVGTKFVNSGLDRRGVPTQWEQTTKESFTCFQIRSRVSNRVVLIKDNCLNPVNRIPVVPMAKRELVETSNLTEVDFDASLEVNIDFNPVITTTASATAQTAPINITINNTQAAAPLMMAGSAPANQYVVVRDARGYLSLGYLVGGGTKVNIQNTNINTNSNENSNVNNNTNTNSNSNANSNTVNVGGGYGIPQPYDPSVEASLMLAPQIFSVNKFIYFKFKEVV